MRKLQLLSGAAAAAAGEEAAEKVGNGLVLFDAAIQYMATTLLPINIKTMTSPAATSENNFLDSGKKTWNKLPVLQNGQGHIYYYY